MRLIKGLVVAEELVVMVTDKMLMNIVGARSMRESLESLLAEVGLGIDDGDDVVCIATPPGPASHTSRMLIRDRNYGRKAEIAENAAHEKAQSSRRLPINLAAT